MERNEDLQQLPCHSGPCSEGDRDRGFGSSAAFVAAGLHHVADRLLDRSLLSCPVYLKAELRRNIEDSANEESQILGIHELLKNLAILLGVSVGHL